MTVLELFKDQRSNVITAEDLPHIKGKTLFESAWQVGDAMCQCLIMHPEPNDDTTVQMWVRLVAPREFEKLDAQYDFIEFRGKWPVFTKKSAAYEATSAPV